MLSSKYLFPSLQSYSIFRDHRPFVRNTAAECINECIRLINARDYQNDQKRDYLDLIYKEVSAALFIDNSDVNHQQSALSILSELIQVKSGSSGSGNDNRNGALGRREESKKNIIMVSP